MFEGWQLFRPLRLVYARTSRSRMLLVRCFLHLVFHRLFPLALSRAYNKVYVLPTQIVLRAKWIRPVEPVMNIPTMNMDHSTNQKHSPRCKCFWWNFLNLDIPGHLSLWFLSCFYFEILQNFFCAGLNRCYRDLFFTGKNFLSLWARGGIIATISQGDHERLQRLPLGRHPGWPEPFWWKELYRV